MAETNINLNFLEFMPQGRKLYSSAYGPLVFNSWIQDMIYVDSECGPNYYFPDGHLISAVGEITLFPSEKCKDWNSWQNYLIEKGDFIVYDSQTFFVSDKFQDSVKLLNSTRIEVIAPAVKILGWASPVQITCFKQELHTLGFTIIDSTIVQESNDKTEKEKEKPSILDSLVPFSKVLVRNSTESTWIAGFFSHYSKSLNGKKLFVTTAASRWKFCLPYNEFTKHLVGTTNPPPSLYK